MYDIIILTHVLKSYALHASCSTQEKRKNQVYIGAVPGWLVDKKCRYIFRVMRVYPRETEKNQACIGAVSGWWTKDAVMFFLKEKRNSRGEGSDDGRCYFKKNGIRGGEGGDDRRRCFKINGIRGGEGGDDGRRF